MNVNQRPAKGISPATVAQRKAESIFHAADWEERRKQSLLQSRERYKQWSKRQREASKGA